MAAIVPLVLWAPVKINDQSQAFGAAKVPLIDMDTKLVEELAVRSVSILNYMGEAGFRLRMKPKLLKTLLQEEAIIATGGGVNPTRKKINDR